MLKSHHQHTGELGRPLALVFGVHLADAIANGRFVRRNLLERRPARFVLRDFRVPVRDGLGVVDTGIDSALEDVGKLCRFGQRLVEVPREVNIPESGYVPDVEERDVAERDRLLEVQRLGDDLELVEEAVSGERPLIACGIPSPTRASSPSSRPTPATFLPTFPESGHRSRSPSPRARPRYRASWQRSRSSTGTTCGAFRPGRGNASATSRSSAG